MYCKGKLITAINYIDTYEYRYHRVASFVRARFGQLLPIHRQWRFTEKKENFFRINITYRKGIRICMQKCFRW